MSAFEPYRQVLRHVQPVGLAGRVRAVRGPTVGVGDFPAPIGAGCRIVRGRRAVEARVVGFAGDETLVMPLGATTGICRGDRVVSSLGQQTVGVGPEMLGRVVDGFGRPIDGKGEIRIDARVPIWPEPIGPMSRRRITEPLATGVRVLDSMLTVGRGQRMSILSGSGLGKSVLLGMIARNTVADVTVIALIGERGREVRDFIERELGPGGLARAVVVVSTSDAPAPLRVQGGAVAAAVAEYFRDRGGDVLLLMDSLTRLATAQREIGLAAGEPPAAGGYTPSVFALLPRLLERAGRAGDGSITAFYNVLVGGDDRADPIADATRAVTDGHVQLSRGLAHRGHFPAVDVLQSVSRVMMDVVAPQHLAAAVEVQAVLAAFEDVADLVSIGAYQRGTSAEYDLAIDMMPIVRRFLAQGRDDSAAIEQTQKSLMDLQRQIAGARRRGVRPPAGPARPAWR